MGYAGVHARDSMIPAIVTEAGDAKLRAVIEGGLRQEQWSATVALTGVLPKCVAAVRVGFVGAQHGGVDWVAIGIGVVQALAGAVGDIVQIHFLEFDRVLGGIVVVTDNPPSQ